MKISEMEAALAKIKAQHGDIELTIHRSGYGGYEVTTVADVTSTTESLWRMEDGDEKSIKTIFPEWDGEEESIDSIADKRVAQISMGGTLYTT